MPVRVYQLAHQLNIESKAVLAALQKQGVDVKVPASTVSEDVAARFLQEAHASKTVNGKKPAETVSQPAAGATTSRTIDLSRVVKDANGSNPLDATKTSIIASNAPPKTSSWSPLKRSSVASTPPFASKDRLSQQNQSSDAAQATFVQKNNGFWKGAPRANVYRASPLPPRQWASPVRTSGLQGSQVTAVPSRAAPSIPGFGKQIAKFASANPVSPLRRTDANASTQAASTASPMRAGDPSKAQAASSTIERGGGQRFASAPMAGHQHKDPRVAPPLHFDPGVVKPTEPQGPSSTSEGDPAAGGALKTVHLKSSIVLTELAMLLNTKPFRLISELLAQGSFASSNQVLEDAVAQEIALRHGVKLVFKRRSQEGAAKKVVEKPKEDETAFLEPKPPVVCILGHVDHGKTTLLDYIRKAHVAAKEAGGMTQHMGAYQVDYQGKKITFLDTPGHAAFPKIRQRGVMVADIAVLVVAADDGFMEQTKEALQFAKQEKMPIVVAINKIDAKGANIDRVKQQMQVCEILSEDWGGDTLCVGISGLNGTNVDQLLEAILLQAEMLELKANPKCAAEGVIIESRVDARCGISASALINRGTLKCGDALVCDACVCKARALRNENGEKVQQAAPAMPVQISGWEAMPTVGAVFHVVKSLQEARQEAEENARIMQQEPQEVCRVKTRDELFVALNEKEKKVLNVVLRADVQGSLEALQDCLRGIRSEKVDVAIKDAQVGTITLNDIHFAHTSNAVIVGFNTKLENGAQGAAKHDGVRILQHDIIFTLLEQVKNAMRELLEPEWVENKLGSAEVRKSFIIAKHPVAGCMVVAGSVLRDAAARLVRKGVVLADTKVAMLKRFKDDVTEVKSGYECGIELKGVSDSYQAGDTIECYEKVSRLPEL